MKFLLLLSIITTLLLANNNNRVILASYSNVNNANNALIRVKYLIRKNPSLKKFVISNKLKINAIQIGEYHTIAVSNFKDYGKILQTKKFFLKYYKDLYVLPPYTFIVKIRITKRSAKPVGIGLRKESYTIEELNKSGENKFIENLLIKSK